MTTPAHIAATIARCRANIAKTQAPPAPASALARWQQLKQHLLALGYSTTNADEKIEELAPGLWEQATLEVNRGTPASATRKAADGGPPHERSDTPMTATEEFTQRRDAYMQAHGCTALAASDAINKEAPALYARHVAEQRAGQAPALKAQPAPAPASVRPHWTVDKLQEMAAQRVAKSRTPLSDHAALLQVLGTPEGRALQDAHYQHNPHLRGTRS